MDDAEWSKLTDAGWRLAQKISTANPNIKHTELMDVVEMETSNSHVQMMAFAFLLSYVKNAGNALAREGGVEVERRPQMGEEVKRVITRVNSKSRKDRAASGK